MELSAAQDIPDAVPLPAAELGRTGAAEMIEQRPLAASVGDANTPVPAGPRQETAEDSIEEDLALVPVEAEDKAQAAPATLPAPVRTLARQSRAPPEEQTAFRALEEPDHARLCENAIQAEHERLAPELAQKITKAYSRLATQHDWPTLAGDGLPDCLKVRVVRFFFANACFQHALQAKKRAAANSAVTAELQGRRKECQRCRREKSLAHDYFCRHESACAWDACAKHLALSVAEEVKIEGELYSEWAQEAINAAICAWQEDLDSAAQVRRDSQARLQAQEAESDRRREVEKQAREQLRPETRRCTDCWEYDEVTGGMCPLHEEKHAALCKAVGSGGSEKPMLAPLSMRTPALQC